MDRFGFIHDKLDIKILILFILRRLPKPVSFDALSELVMVDDGFDYFEYSQCLSELVASDHVEHSDNFYKITRIGDESADAVENSIPYSVRLKAEQNARPLIEKMKRDALIAVSHEKAKNGGVNVRLSLSDGIGEVISLSALVSDDAQAQQIEQNFRTNAEDIYHKIIAVLSGGDQKGENQS